MSSQLSYAEVCQRLKCSSRQVQRFIDRGLLTRSRDKPTGHCRVWFDASQVAELERSWKRERRSPPRIDSRLVERNIRGRIAAKVFALLNQGADLRAIVIATEADPMIVRELYDEWSTDFRSGQSKRRQEKAAADERATQREYDKAERDRVWREQQVTIAKHAGKSRKAG